MPLPALAYWISPGLDFANAINSFTFFAGNCVLLTSRYVPTASGVTSSKSFTGSKPGFR